MIPYVPVYLRVCLCVCLSVCLCLTLFVPSLWVDHTSWSLLSGAKGFGCNGYSLKEAILSQWDTLYYTLCFDCYLNLSKPNACILSTVYCYIVKHFDSRPLNKIQNSIIVLIFKVWKIRYCREYNSKCQLWVSLRWHHCDVSYKHYFCVRQHICYSAYMLLPIWTSGRLSVTLVDQSKTVEVRIMQLWPQDSPMTLVSSRSTSRKNSIGNPGSGGAK